MTRSCRNRWIAVAVIWVAAAALALWNLETIGRLTEVAGAQATRSANRQFIAAHEGEFDRIEERLSSLVRPVDSAAIGLLYLEQDLANLAVRCNLAEFKLAGQPEGGRENLPVSVSFAGNLSDASRWLATVEAQMPYLSVNGLEAVPGSEKGAPRFTVSLVFRYQVLTPKA